MVPKITTKPVAKPTPLPEATEVTLGTVDKDDQWKKKVMKKPL